MWIQISTEIINETRVIQYGRNLWVWGFFYNFTTGLHILLLAVGEFSLHSPAQPRLFPRQGEPRAGCFPQVTGDHLGIQITKPSDYQAGALCVLSEGSPSLMISSSMFLSTLEFLCPLSAIAKLGWGGGSGEGADLTRVRDPSKSGERVGLTRGWGGGNLDEFEVWGRAENEVLWSKHVVWLPVVP